MNKWWIRGSAVSAIILLAGCSTISGWFTSSSSTENPDKPNKPAKMAPAMKPAPEDAMLLIDGKPAPQGAKCKVAVQVLPYTGRDDSIITVPGYVTFLIDAGKWGDIQNVKVIGSEPGDRYVQVASEAMKEWKFETEMPDHRHHPMRCRLTMHLDPSLEKDAANKPDKVTQ